MKKRLFSLVLALALCMGLTVPAMAYGDTGKAGNTNPVSSGFGHAGIIDTNGSLWMWGYNNDGQVGNGRKGDSTYQTQGYTYPCQTTPVKVLDDVASFSCGANFTAAVKTDGSLWVWGSNQNNQLGIAGAGDFTYKETMSMQGHEMVRGTYLCQTVPMKIMDGVMAVSCGTSHAAAIKTDGTVWTWGTNSDGRLGNGTLTQSRIPVQVLDNAVAVSCGTSHTAAIKNDGSLWMWGDNSNGQLGNGGVGNTTKDIYKNPIQTVPVKVMDNAVTVSCGSDMTAAVKTDGTLWTWGNESTGNLGNGAFDSGRAKSPVQIDTNIASVSASTGSSGAITQNGILKMWGDDTYGALGTGLTGIPYYWENGGVQGALLGYYVDRPTSVMEDVAAVSGGNIMVIVKKDGTVWVCGSNKYGELGNKNLTNKTVKTIPCQTVPAQLTGFTAKLPGKFTLVPGSTTSPSVNRFGNFTDVKEGDYFADAVLWALEKNITSGTSKTTFSPGQTCSTAEIITLIWRANGEPLPVVGDGNFFDNVGIGSNEYYAVAAMWAQRQGLVSGKIFHADKPCTRADVVTYLWKLAGSPAAAQQTSFTDVPASADYAQAVAWAVDQKITSGTGGGKFSPAATCTRGQIVTFLHRAMA